jgi:hypothetical protein
VGHRGAATPSKQRNTLAHMSVHSPMRTFNLFGTYLGRHRVTETGRFCACGHRGQSLRTGSESSPQHFASRCRPSNKSPRTDHRQRVSPSQLTSQANEKPTPKNETTPPFVGSPCGNAPRTPGRDLLRRRAQLAGRYPISLVRTRFPAPRKQCILAIIF